MENEKHQEEGPLKETVPGEGIVKEKTEEKPAGTEPLNEKSSSMLSRCAETLRKWLGLGQAS